MINERVITKEDAIKLANDNSLPYYEASAKSKENIENAILFLTNIVYQNIKEIQSENNKYTLTNKNKKEFSCK